MELRTEWDKLARKPYIWLALAFIYLYRVCVWWCYWNWFVASALKIPPLNYLHAMGLVVFLDVFKKANEEPAHARRRWEICIEGLELLMSEEQKKKWTTVIKEIMQDNVHGPGYMKWKLFEDYFGRFLLLTVALLLGFLVKLGAELL